MHQPKKGSDTALLKLTLQWGYTHMLTAGGSARSSLPERSGQGVRAKSCRRGGGAGQGREAGGRP